MEIYAGPEKVVVVSCNHYPAVAGLAIDLWG